MQRSKNKAWRLKNKFWKARHECPNCHRFVEDGHFVGPSLGEEAFYICKQVNVKERLDETVD